MIGPTSRSFFAGQAYTHNGDYERMRALGLKTNFNYDWTDVGTVAVGPGRTVRVEVSAMPAQFFRFTVTRPKRHEPRIAEVVRFSTGSGGFQTYYDVIERFARYPQMTVNGVLRRFQKGMIEVDADA